MEYPAEHVYYSGNWENLIIYSDQLGQLVKDNPSGVKNTYYSIEEVAEIMRISTNGVLKEIESRRLQAHERIRYEDDCGEYVGYVPAPSYYITMMLLYPGRSYKYIMRTEEERDDFRLNGPKLWKLFNESGLEESGSIDERRFPIIASIAEELGLDLHRLKRGQKIMIERVWIEKTRLTADNFKRAWQAALDNKLIG